MYVCLAIWALLMFTMLVKSVRDGNAFIAVTCVLLASPILLAILAVEVEGRQLNELVSLRHGAWSFLIGDTLVLTSAVAFAALGWRSISHEGWIVSWWWTMSCALIGLGAGALFHKWEIGKYMREGAGDRLLSPTKLAHDFVAYPVLFGALTCIGIPLLMHRSWHSWAALVCVIIIWGGLAVCDGLRGLSPLELHPGWDATDFRVVALEIRITPP